MAQAGIGLMAFWADFEPEHVLRYQEWHNCEHVPERVSIPGFLRGRRYRALDGRPHFLMFYETADPGVLNSQPYLDALNSPTPWSREVLGCFRNPVRNVYRLAAASGAGGRFVAPWITSLRFNHASQRDGRAISDWIEALAGQSEVARVRLYEVDEEISRIMTSERKIYGGDPGAQQYLAMIEHGARPDRPESLERADAAVPAWAEGRRNEFCASYWLEIAHDWREAD